MRFRFKAVAALAALYAFCILAPHAALAFADAASAVHCLTEDHGFSHSHHHGSVHAHVHADGTVHQPAERGVPPEHSDADGKVNHASCCGLFCVTALAAEPSVALVAPPPSGMVVPSADHGLTGRGPDRLNRPPIA